MRRLLVAVCLTIAVFSIAILSVPRAATADGCCGSDCTICRPKWEDRKTKKPTYSMKCEPECVRGFDAWCDHGCCPECSPPAVGVFTKKRLMKQEDDKVERILKYDLVRTPPTPSEPPKCRHHHPCWYDLPGLCRRLFGM